MTTLTSTASSLGTPPTDPILSLFEELATTTWDWLGLARQLGLTFSEETVTDIAALQIADGALDKIKVAKTTKKQEKRCGIDWMWFIGNQRQKYTRYAVQAKKITLEASTTYSYRIRHPVNGIHGSEFQIEVLEQFAKNAHAIPLYCFYNNVDQALAARYWHCRTYPSQPDDIRQMGCTLVPLDWMKIVHTENHSKQFSAIHQDHRSIPWRCLFHPTCTNAFTRDWNRFLLNLSYLSDSSTDHEGDLVSQDFDPQIESLPDFLRGDDAVVEFETVIQGLNLSDFVGDVDSDDELSSNSTLPIPQWFLVIETDPT